ncbi:transmembrane protein 114-like [Paramacrobiotus metropolitanus]|uniref:transmembrane protein 114-like n=1 Tax=Paramacrobiotus metropolitanus TaxID=2943436 RepID=UPI00244612DE|nr:transmembrane protein 114-like [Paramacrobiotus metropolitanus]
MPGAGVDDGPTSAPTAPSATTPPGGSVNNGQASRGPQPVITAGRAPGPLYTAPPKTYIYTGHSHGNHHHPTHIPLHPHGQNSAGHHPHHHLPGQGSHGHDLSFERKCLLAATSATVIGLILMIVAVTTDYWLIVTNPGGAYLSHDKLFRMSSHSGIWRICNIDFRNETYPYRIDTQCKRHMLFPSELEAMQNQHEFDTNSLDYTRSEVAFSTIALILMIFGQGFAFYSFKERRYMFKRLTGFLHILSAVCCLICIEVLVSSVTYEKQHLPTRHPATAVSHFGFSFVLACVACAAYFAAGIIFLVFSRKKKADKSVTEMKTLADDELDQIDADAPMTLGR